MCEYIVKNTLELKLVLKMGIISMTLIVFEMCIFITFEYFIIFDLSEKIGYFVSRYIWVYFCT